MFILCDADYIAPASCRDITLFMCVIGADALKTIYHSILSQHISMSNFHPLVQKCTEKVVTCALQLHQKVASTFLPTAIKFHYIFNLRDLSNIFQGLLFGTPECVKKPLDFLRLWLHEASRVYGDKFVDEKDMELFDSMKNKVAKDVFDVGFVGSFACLSGAFPGLSMDNSSRGSGKCSVSKVTFP
jgi:hypothetical protein